jgi:D-serine deaminase-like pyridoxal phosphate-dependent protein
MFEWIRKPTLLINEQICKKNIERMAEKAKHKKLIFRPHFKTHQSIEIGEWFREFGVEKITVSSVTMARAFAKAGWNDITIAFPLNLREFPAIMTLAKSININVLIADVETMFFLKKSCSENLGFFIKIDVGNHRVGLLPDDTEAIEKILELAKKNETLTFRGFLAHAGHTYHAKNAPEIENIHASSCHIMTQVKQRLKTDYPQMICSIGDTPSCSLMEDFTGIDEIRPGNFVFYDEMQYQLGSCNEGSIALIAACPVVSKNRKRNEIVIYGGAVHLSKEFLPIHGGKIFGKVVFLDENGWQFTKEPIWITSLSQEHGIMSVQKDFLDSINIGDVIGIIPVHSCLTANLYNEYFTLNNHKIKRIDR